MGTSLQELAAGVSLIATADTWIEGSAIQQLQTTARLPGMHRVVGMPDLHPGRGYPVGAAFFSIGRLYPALIGNDIGCGMSLWRTDLSAAKASGEALERRLGSIDGPLGEEWAEDIAAFGLPRSGYETALGTIGGGNHFAELQQIDAVHDGDALDALQLSRKQVLLLVHSGSRGLGQAILRRHVEAFGHRGLEQGTPECLAYLDEHGQALRFARANRTLIARRIAARLRAAAACVLDVDHNLLQARTVDGVAGWLHRKGATPADAGPVVIPGSRGDYSYLVQPVADARSLFSLAHGAGRKWMRSECRERLAGRYTIEQLQRTALGSRVVCRDRELIYEEVPQAYKSVDSVVEALAAAGLVRVLARLRPLLSYKTAGECC